MLTDPEASGPTLAELSAASGLEPRTIRSWIAQGLLPPPLNRGPAARYPAETLQRLLAIVAMREHFNMSMQEVRLNLLASPEKIAEYAARFPELPRKPGRVAAAADPRDALDYLAALKAGTPASEAVARVSASGFMASPSVDAPEPLPLAQPRSQPRSGLAALEQALGGDRKSGSQRRSRTEEWLRIPITPDLELSARGKLNDDERARLERIAALIRTIITGG
jgi:DNA-binding transcriptional MerR regulator